MTTLEKIKREKIITIIRGVNVEDAISVTKAIRDGGLCFVEVTFNQTAPPSVTADIIRTLRELYQDQMCFGAGTVMTLEQLNAAYEARAEFILSPNADRSIIKQTKKLGLVSIPGAFTPTEIAQCYHEGADIVKVFPSDSMGPSYIKALRGPLPHIPLSAVGGVNLDNICDFFQAGACSVGIGSNIVDKQAVATKDFDKIRSLSAAYAEKIK